MQHALLVGGGLKNLLKVLPHAVKERNVPFYDGSNKTQGDSGRYKEEWKKEVRDVDKKVHESPLGTGFAHKDTKSNKPSKAQKRQMRKTL